MSTGGVAPMTYGGYGGVRRVILTRRSEVDSESRRQPAVFMARSATDD